MTIYLLEKSKVLTLFLTFIFLLLFGIVKAEGSKETNMNSTSRATLQLGTTADFYWPYKNNGRHYVYAKAGEKIALAAVSGVNIQITTPSGISTNYKCITGQGTIANTQQETAGPKLSSSDIAPNRYNPFYYTVTTSGVYKIEFSVNYSIGYWDISVIDSTGNNFIKGRVFTSVLSLAQNGSFAIYYILTTDGYTYRVNLNGMNGASYTFLSNNTGFVNTTTREPIYKSLSPYTVTSAQNILKSPNIANTNKEHTHKIFYNLPNKDLPTESIAPTPLVSSNNMLTPLKITPVSLDVSNISLTGSENTPNQIGAQGGKIKFTTSTTGSYIITIKDSSLNSPFATKIITGKADRGDNIVLWDGKDGNGNQLNTGTHNVKVNVQLTGAEVHFPYFDIETNSKGIIIELLNDNYTNSTQPSVISDIIYWDDSSISNLYGGDPIPKSNSHLNPNTGISSNANGHKFTNNFGDNKALDTWAFIVGQEITTDIAFTFKVADLKIESINTDQLRITPGLPIKYTVKVKNDGPSDVMDAKFNLHMPSGINVTNINFSSIGNCGQEARAISYNASENSYVSFLNMPNGCEVIYQITAVASNNITSGRAHLKATILRPNDISDPDATNTNTSLPNYTGPNDINIECSYNGLNGNCNNIKSLYILQDSGQICETTNETHNFNVTSNSSRVINTINTDLGFNIDLYNLEDLLSIKVNGTNIVNEGLNFGTNPNVHFQDGDQYNINTPAINTMIGTTHNPLVRISIDGNGNVVLYGVKIANGPLFNLEINNGFYLNSVNLSNNNTITISTTSTENSIIGRLNTISRITCPCYEDPQMSGTALPTLFGITDQNRIHDDNSNWPYNRNGGHMVLESNTKGFVITRLSKIEIEGQQAPNIIKPKIVSPIEGMMVYDTTEKCLKIYIDNQWKCFSNPGCPNK